jgi:hypothetical protein
LLTPHPSCVSSPTGLCIQDPEGFICPVS